MHRNIIHVRLILIAVLAASAALGQEWEVRTFLDQTGAADATTNTDDTFQYLQSNIKAQWVCPFCSFSREKQTVGGSSNCPDPWGAHDHPADVALRDLNPLLRQRLLSLTSQDMDDNKVDLDVTDITGLLHPRAILGRPFKPFELDANGTNDLRRSRLCAQAANLNSPGSPVNDDTPHLRFLVIPPTPLRREAQGNDTADQDQGLPNRRPMAQVQPYDADDAGDEVEDDPATTAVDENALDLADDSWPRVLARGGNAHDVTVDGEIERLDIGVNPYRVDDGDYWWVRYREEYDGTGVQRISVEVYSVLYGWQGAVVSGTPTALAVDSPAWADANGNGTVDPGEDVPLDIDHLDIVVPSGALRLRFNLPWSTATSGGIDHWNTWTVGFMTRSNCRLIPGWQDMVTVDAAATPRFRGLDGVLYGTPGLKLAETDPADNDDFPGPKTPSFATTTGTGPTITTETDIEGPAGQPEGYILPPNATGMGTIAVQWAGDLADDADWDTATYTEAGNDVAVYCLRDDPADSRDTSYAEWQYDTTRNVTNAELMPAPVENFAAGVPYVQLMAARFMCTRPDVLLTNNGWDWNADNVDDGIPAETSTYPKAIIGWLSTTGLVSGSFAPGGTTPQRPLHLVNRWDGQAETTVCGACGEVWGPQVATPPNGMQQRALADSGVCPYHQAPTVAVSGAGDISYNSTLTNPYSQRGMFNGHAFYREDGADGRFLFFSTLGHWTLAETLGDDTDWDYRTQDAGAPLDLGISWMRRPPPHPSANPPPASVVMTGAATAGISPLGGGGFKASHDTWRAITATGHDERLASLPDKRHVLPGQAIIATGPTVGHDNDYNAGYTAAQREQLSAAIPRYQPPSVPGTGAVNNFALDRGYRGGEVLYHNITAPNGNSPLTDGWDVFYKNPDNGYFQSQAGQWPFRVNDSIVFAAALPAGATEIPGRHFYCRVCGAEFRDNPGRCPFDGWPQAPAVMTDANRIPYASAVREEHLVAEEYDPFDVQVSVARKGGVTQTTEDVPIGRVTPGVVSTQPDLTTGVLTDHRAFPSDTSLVPRAPYRASDSKVLLRNEGNVQVPLRLANAYVTEPGSSDRALDHYLRVDVDPTSSYGRKARSGPLTRDTFAGRVAGDPAELYEKALNTNLMWNTLASEPGSAAGNDAYGYVIAGRAGKPVPLGQPVGTYAGSHLQYIDTNNSKAFEFRYWDGVDWANATTGPAFGAFVSRQFNPATDLADEPLTGLLRGQSRVFESRLPQNDYYARDSDPVVLPSPTPGRMQVIWSTNRVSTHVPTPAGMTAGAPGTNQGHLPGANAPSNLVYSTATGQIDVANDPLYRRYYWPVDAGTGLLERPGVMTTDGGAVINGAPWVMYNLDGTAKWAYWQRQQRHAGGVDSRLLFNSVAGDTWTWPAPLANNFIYDTGLMKQGLRGFARPGGAWLFWHAGTPGREALNYRWDFTGTSDNKQALLPVSSVLSGGTTDLATALLPEGGTATIRRPRSSPFTSTKDVSVFSTGNTAHVFFSGFITTEGQSDICWTQYRIADDPIAATNTSPLGKLPFRRITDNEEMATDGYHQLFGSRHLDWQVGQHFAAGVGDVANPLFNDLSPAFELRLAFGDGTVRRFTVTWYIDLSVLPSAEYDRALTDYRNRGVYRVTPVLTGIDGATLPAGYGIDEDNDGDWYLQDPNGPAGRRLTMDINPAAGTVQFGCSLFDEDLPNSRRTVLGDDNVRTGLEGLRDVALCVNYNPYVYRVTRSGAQDDAPSASWDGDLTQRLVVFWRRSYPTSEAPHFGRPAFMYKVYSTSVQVGRPPVETWNSVTNATAGYATANNPGILTAVPGDIGRYLTINYTATDGKIHTERHQVIGWSREMMVPVDTVVGEGALVAVPEQFDVPATDPADADVMQPAVRYWLFWSSPRGVYDMRLVENPDGTRAEGPYDLAVHPSSDIYSAVVAPEFGSLPPERTLRAVPLP